MDLSIWRYLCVIFEEVKRKVDLEIGTIYSHSYLNTVTLLGSLATSLRYSLVIVSSVKRNLF